MSDKAWTDKRQFRQLSHELRALSRDAFADRVLELLRIRWPECIEAPRLRAIDRSGVDLYVWNEGKPYALAVQCKGFEVSEERLGDSQVRQCVASIESFRASDVQSERYFLIYNRDGRDADFRIPVQTAVASLMTSKRVRQAEMWSEKHLLREVFNGMGERISAALDTSAKRDADFLGAFEVEPLAIVPLRETVLVIDRHRLQSEGPVTESLDDPSALLLDAETPSLTLLLGEAGYGKTTAARRAAMSTKKRVFFIPAAKIDSQIVGTKDLLQRCIDIDELLEIADLDGVALWRRVARPVVEQLVKHGSTNAVLLFDGLDESPFLARNRGALQHFFNFFNSVRIPVVLTARTEFWIQRKDDLRETWGMVGEHKGGIRKHVRQVELIDWQIPQMAEFARRYTATLNDDAGRRVGHLIAALENGEYATYYGDIPRRPLFLRMIIDTVASGEIHRVRRAELFLEWALFKVRRDIHEPQLWGTSGRGPIANETATRDTIELSFAAMDIAARLMTERTGDQLVLLPTCDLRALAQLIPLLSAIGDLTGLGLNSLLVPVETSPPQPLRLRFAHMLFQEFFLARYVAAHSTEFADVRLPTETSKFLNEMI